MEGPGVQAAVDVGLVIRVPERGRARLDADAWARLRHEPVFWQLVSQGIVGVELPGSGVVEVEGRSHVGRALCGDVLLEVSEKIPGALAGMLRYASYDAFRLQRLPTARTEFGPLAALLASEFLAAVHRYVSGGRDGRYARPRCASSMLGGKIDITRSIGLRARGLRHRVVHERNEFTRRTPLNRIILAALVEIGRLARIVALSEADTVRLRSLSMLFSDCRDEEVLFGPREKFVEESAAIAESPSATGRDRGDLATLAGIVLSRESFEPGAALRGRAPRTWFLNLERLFEIAVRNATRAVLSQSDARVVRGSAVGAPVFASDPARFIADPDVVVQFAGENGLVMDCKYKDASTAPAHSDVYQILVHCEALHSRTAVLVYPGEAGTLTRIGRTEGEIELTLATVRPSHLGEDVKSLLDAFGYAVAEPAAAGAHAASP